MSGAVKQAKEVGAGDDTSIFFFLSFFLSFFFVFMLWYYFFHENYFYFFMFRNFPGYSGMLRVPGFIDAQLNCFLSV